MKKSRVKTIAICASASFFKEAVGMEPKLKKLGLKVKMPFTAMRMKRDMENHFNKIMRSDAVLVLNYEKHGVKGYIGGATLTEMAIASHYKKPIYILNRIAGLPYEEEILGFQPTFIDEDIMKIV